MSVAALYGFRYWGEKTDDPEFAWVGVLLAGFFAVSAVVMVLRNSMNKTFDGVVVDKRVRDLRHRDYESTGLVTLSIGDSRGRNFQHIIVVRDNRGRKHKKNVRTPEAFNYFQIGDRVRYHGKLGTLEKYDKSRDRIILCNVCERVNDIREDKCKRCKAPLFK